MTRAAFRLVRRRYVQTALSGEGARRFGGRFNSPGRSVVYASSTLSLAVLEILVHATRPSDLADYTGSRLTFGEGLAREIGPLPDHWRDNSWPDDVQALGDVWLEGEHSAVLRVPSAVLPSEFNYLINPEHPDTRLVEHQIVELDIDPRVYRVGTGGGRR